MLSIKFNLWLKDKNIETRDELAGPIFTRWLPDGENDALKISVSDNSAEVFLWFESHGTVRKDGVFITYEHNKYEIDPKIIPKQKKIYAGILYGKVVFKEVSPAIISVLKNGETENEEYIRLGKLVVKKILDPTLSRFTKILRNTYGQYWIGIYQKFDSRKLPLANHCYKLNMKWCIESGESGDFVPGTTEIETLQYTISSCPEKEFISHEAWLNIQTLLAEEFEPSLSSVFASRSNQLLAEERYSHALIEAVIAIDLSLQEYVRRTVSFTQNVKVDMNGFWNCSLPSRIALIASLAGINSEDVSLSIAGVIQRNKLVHEGKELDSSVSAMITGLLKTICYLNNDQPLRYPFEDDSNSLGDGSVLSNQSFEIKRWPTPEKEIE